MKATIKAENHNFDYELTITDDDYENKNFVEIILQQKNEDYFETWTVTIEDLYDVVRLFEQRRIASLAN
jgi:hypothetical protein